MLAKPVSIFRTLSFKFDFMAGFLSIVAIIWASVSAVRVYAWSFNRTLMFAVLVPKSDPSIVKKLLVVDTPVT